MRSRKNLLLSRINVYRYMKVNAHNQFKVKCKMWNHWLGRNYMETFKILTKILKNSSLHSNKSLHLLYTIKKKLLSEEFVKNLSWRVMKLFSEKIKNNLLIKTDNYKKKQITWKETYKPKSKIGIKIGSNCKTSK